MVVGNHNVLDFLYLSTPGIPFPFSKDCLYLWEISEEYEHFVGRG